MATTTAKTKETNGEPKKVKSPNPNDIHFLAYMRNNSQQIVSGLSTAAARAGDLQRWNEMNLYLTHANKISAFCGLQRQQTETLGTPAASAAVAGAQQ